MVRIRVYTYAPSGYQVIKVLTDALFERFENYLNRDVVGSSYEFVELAGVFENLKTDDAEMADEMAYWGF